MVCELAYVVGKHVEMNIAMCIIPVQRRELSQRQPFSFVLYLLSKKSSQVKSGSSSTRR